MMRVRAYSYILLTIGCVIVSACGGGNSGSVPSLSTSQSQSQVVMPASTHVIPNYQPSPTPNEELIISWVVCGTPAFEFICDPQQPVVNVIGRYSLSTGAVLPGLTLQPGAQGVGAQQTVASAGDQYFLTSEILPTSQVEVNRASGLVGTVRSFGSALLLMSSDLMTALLVGDNGQFGVYRAPFLTASGGGTQPNGYQPATNSNGSQMFVASSNGTTMTATTYAIPTHKTTAVSWRTNQQVSQLLTGLYDARHAWYYVMSQPNQIQIVDTGHGKYLGYINLPESTPNSANATLDPISSDLYVGIGRKIYVYNIGECGCTVPRRVLTAPMAGMQITVDRNNEHLIAYTTTCCNSQQGLDTIFDDLNPKTGAVQRQFPTLSGDVFTLITVNSVLAQ